MFLSLKKWLKQNKLILFFLAFLVFAVYFNSLSNDFLSDDIAAIRDNPNIDKTGYFWRPPYFNLNPQLLINFLTFKFFALNPTFYRIPNILFHLGSTWLIFALISLLFNFTTALFTASIFAIHPLLTESVTWISGAPYSNGAFFALLSFLTYIWSAKSKRFCFLSVFSFYLALLFSEKLIIFPLILLLYEFCFAKLKSNWPKLIPFWLLSGLWVLSLVGLLGARTAALEIAFYQKPGITNPLLQIPIAITSYLELIFWPKNLTLYHSEMSFSQAQYYLRLGIFTLFLITIAYFYKKDRRIFFWLSFFIISLLPTLTPLGISWIVAERYVYLGSLGIFVFVALAINKIGQLAKDKQVTYLILSVLLILLSSRTILRNNDWKNQDTLWLAMAKTSPSSPQNHNNLGDYYGRQGDFQRSIEEFKKAIELNPGYADAYHNLANTYAQIGKTEEAIANYQKAIEFGPHLWQSHQNLAAIYFHQEKYGLAEEELQKAIQINPQNPNLYISLAVVYFKLNDVPNAQNSLKTALRLDPQNLQAKQLLLRLTP